LKFKDFQFIPKKRRGLSSVVGALLFVVLMVSAFSMLGLVLDVQENQGITAKMVATAELKKQQENFKINIFTDPNQLLTVDVDNIGQNAVEIATLIITNSSDVANGFPTAVYDIPSDTSFVGPRKNGNVVSSTPLTLGLAQNPGDIELYHFKVISSLGTIKTTSVSCDNTACGAISSGGGGLTATLFLDGPNGVHNKTSTVVMFVSNTADVAITAVQPAAGFEGGGTCSANLFVTIDNSTATQTLFVEDVDPCFVSPSSPITLDPHATTLFKWDGTILGDIGSVFTFCSAVSGTHPNDGPITSGGPTCDSLTIIDPNDCSGCGPGEDGGGDEHAIDDRFITRPELFLTVASPFGSFGNPPGGQPIARALWGANVVNPTETVMLIHKITITAYAPTANSNIVIIKPGGSNNLDCNPQDISPKNGTFPGTQEQEAGFWSCPGENTIMWKNFAAPIVLPANSVYPFMVYLEASDTGNDNVESVLVDSTVFTTSGSFGKGNYQSTWFQNGMYGNIFLHEDIDGVDITKIHTERSGIQSNSIQTFHINLAEFDWDDTTFINSPKFLQKLQ